MSKMCGGGDDAHIKCLHSSVLVPADGVKNWCALLSRFDYNYCACSVWCILRHRLWLWIHGVAKLLDLGAAAELLLSSTPGGTDTLYLSLIMYVSLSNDVIATFILWSQRNVGALSDVNLVSGWPYTTFILKNSNLFTNFRCLIWQKILFRLCV